MQNLWHSVTNYWVKVIPILKLRESLVKDSQLTLNYIVLIVSSCLIATFGLILNSTAVIIGAMIIAPLMLPLRGFSFATLEGDLILLRSSFSSIAAGTLIAFISSSLVGLVIGIPEFGTEVLARTQPNLVDLLIAIVAGGISAYAKIRPSLGDALPGTAIAVALMPPICVIGLTFSQGLWQLSFGAFLLYFTNLIGINLACICVYVISGYARKSQLGRSVSWGVSLFLIALLAVPLGVSFIDLVQQAQVNDSVRRVVANSPLLTEENMQLTKTEVFRDTNPPLIKVDVRSTQPITPEQVTLFEASLKEELGETFKVIFDVTQSSQVEAVTPAAAN
ncbi:MAG: DUF389 domain-containing protein [Oscillatoria sp. PMC 1051.18]|uniref:DUF389 domain-containing protein n=1 Tax=Oscillatoria salina TaxID=331517 RepID=UPI0013B8226C|nr:DUF389 domain-containing protein [Oscillatoria salina]MBZ8180482.1 DUF389 domain-containing protein [Oscillatoria salina IIICB1]MEC4895594.1 DUF389 domain-containing protein [Oscillatoria sp. PMC 1050.18]MEC5031857.1 DUF389 domain-containing protein [Oscillatoria sp. PMC 1051.18]NET87983.1 DUF389 domain-containing protein [Kamptonema sp. SIO1D9]